MPEFKVHLETSHIPVILLTAKNTVEDRVECYNAGADGYIAKPFELKILEARINNFISHKRSQTGRISVLMRMRRLMRWKLRLLIKNSLIELLP